MKIKNTCAIVLRGAYLHGPYTLYVVTYPSTFDPNYRDEALDQHGSPDFEPNLKAGGSWTSRLKMPDNIRETADKANVKRTADGGLSSFTWILEVSSQVLFSVTASVNFEILVGRDEKSVELGFATLTGQAASAAGNLEDHQQGTGKSRNRAAQPKGVFSKAINLVVDDTASLWNKPTLPQWDDSGKDRGKKPDSQKYNDDTAPLSKRMSGATITGEQASKDESSKKRRKKVHLVVLTHGLHSNLGADMLYLKESIDAAAKEAREDARKRKVRLRSQDKQKTPFAGPGEGTTSREPESSQGHGNSTAPLSGGQDDLHSRDDDESDEDEEEVIVRGFSGNAIRTERGIQYLGKRLAKYVLTMTYPDQPFLPTKKSMTQSLSRAFTGSQSSGSREGPPAHKDSSIHRGSKRLNNLAYKITSISFIAHSLGGLTQTYAIAYIHKHSPHFFESIKPINFVTMASPLLGLSNENPIYVKFALDFGLVGRIGQDLGLTWRAPTMVRNGWGAMIGGIGSEGQRAHRNPDSGAKSLFRVLPTGPAHQVLKMFRNRTVYSNVVNDGIVPLRTSCLLFLDWSGLGRVEKARRENGLIGTVAGWGWAEMTGANSTERRHRAWDSNGGSQAGSGGERSRSNSATRQHHTTVSQPSDDATKDDILTQGYENVGTPSSANKHSQRFQDEEYDAGKFKEEAPAQPQHSLSGFLNFLRPNQNKSHQQSPKQTKIYRRGQTIKAESDNNGANSSENSPTSPGRPGMARGESLLEDRNSVFAPPKTTFFESAGDILNPPLPTEQFLIDPSSRARTIFHDRIYHPGDIPPPRDRKRSALKRTFSSDNSKHSLERSNTDYGLQPSAQDTSDMKVEEKIARAYHHDLSWRKVLVRLEPDAHNNIFVRRMFSNAYGWPVIKHLVDTHFSSDYAAVTADEDEPSLERAKPITEPVGEHGEEVKDEIPKPVPRTNSEIHEAKDNVTDLHVLKKQGSSMSSSNTGTGGAKQRLSRQDSAQWDDAIFDVTDDDDDIDSPLEARHKKQASAASTTTTTTITTNDSEHSQRRGTSETEIADFLSAEPEKIPEGLDIESPTKPEPAVVTSQPEKVPDMAATPLGTTAGVGLGKSVEEQMRRGKVEEKGEMDADADVDTESEQKGLMGDVARMSLDGT